MGFPFFILNLVLWFFYSEMLLSALFPHYFRNFCNFDFDFRIFKMEQTRKTYLKFAEICWKYNNKVNKGNPFKTWITRGVIKFYNLKYLGNLNWKRIWMCVQSFYLERANMWIKYYISIQDFAGVVHLHIYLIK